MPTFLQKLVRNGNSTQVTIPVQVLDFCGWSAGQRVIVEPLTNRTIHVRLPELADLDNRAVLPPGYRREAEQKP